MSQRKSKSQRGLILLVVLGMLTLFSLLAVTFVVFSSNSRKDAIAITTVTSRQPDHRAISEQAIMQFLRGTNDPNSALYKQSLLEDLFQQMYASSTFVTVQHPVQGTFRSADGVVQLGTGSVLPLLKVPLEPTSLPTLTNDPYGATRPADDAYNGRLFTFLGGPLAGHTFRIVRYIGDRVAGAPDFALRNSVVLDISNLSGQVLTAKTMRGEISKPINRWFTTSGTDDILELIQDFDGVGGFYPYKFLINAAPFAGVGYGLTLDTTRPGGAPEPHYGNLGMRIPLEPGNGSSPMISTSFFHSLAFPYVSADSASGISASSTPWWNGGTAEGYDVPDYRDQFLTYRPTGTPTSLDIIPSFHRPEVVNYITNLFPPSMTVDQLVRMVQLIDYASARPLSVNITNGGTPIFVRNQNFSGGAKPAGGPQPQLNVDISQSNADSIIKNFVAWHIAASWDVNGDGVVNALDRALMHWDVDNDGDGISDSIWLDLNLPLITMADGKLVKILVAPMIEDMDSRLNIQAVGDMSQADTGYTASTNAAFTTNLIYTDPSDLFLPQGLGFGPADISVSHLLPVIAMGANNPFVVRNGRDTGPGLVDTPATAADDDDDLDSTFYQREIADRHAHGARGGFAAMGTSNARRGGIAIGIDRFGNPIMLNNTFGGNIPSETENDPYENKPLKGSPADAPFTLAELERVLRAYDSSAEGLPNRLRALLSTSGMVDINRLITTRSNELRHPRIGIPSESAPGDLLGWIKMLHEERYRVKPAPGDPFDPAIHDPALTLPIAREFFPVEFRRGLPLNINRTFGDGLDNDGDGTVDDPHEILNNVQSETYPGGTSVAGTYFTGSFVPSSIQLGTRQQLAQQLYCLAYLLVPQDYAFPGPGGATPDQLKQRRARALAQWAINIVDFRDGDCAHTKFPYDAFPFGRPDPDPLLRKAMGWAPQPGCVVWGAEFPELQLSESLAFHDIKTKDTNDDDGPGTMTTSGTPDPDRDQYRLPQGSLILEVQSTRTTGGMNDPSLPAAPSSLYTIDAGGNVTLDLGRIAPASPAYGTQPVWRIGISNVTPEAANPNTLLQGGGASAAVSQMNQSYQFTKSATINGLMSDVTNLASMQDFARIVWFASLDPATVPAIPNILDETGANRDKFVYYNRQPGQRFLPGGGYCVVGPRQTTYIGSQNSSATPPQHRPSPQRIVLNTSSVDTHLMNGIAQANPGTSKPALGMVCAANTLSAAWDAILVDPAHGMYGVGLNISEPDPVTAANYYRIPNRRLNGTDAGLAPYPGGAWGFQDLPMDSWIDYNNAGAAKLPDNPFDADPVRNPVLNNPIRPTATLGTHTNVRAAYLQRLADPEMPYDPNENPYLTIDFITIDLTVFNGEDSEPMPAGANVAFQSRYKDGADMMHLVGSSTIANAAPVAKRATTGTSMMSYSTAQPVRTPTYNGTYLASTVTPYFNYQLGYSSYPATPGDTTDLNYRYFSASTLGYLNSGRPLNNVAAPTPADFDAYGPPIDSPINGYDGAPPQRVSSMFCLNRTYSSPMELMMVSAAGPGHVNLRSTHFNSTVSPYLLNPPTQLPSPFGQLMNTFEASTMKLANGAGFGTTYWQHGNNNPMTPLFDLRPASEDLNLLFELIETPPPFSDSTNYLRPDSIPGAIVPDLVAPYHYMPTYNRPGKVNINTVPGDEVWKGVEYAYLHHNATSAGERAGTTGNTNWANLQLSRRGYAAPKINGMMSGFAQNPNLNSDFPSQFAGAFSSGYLSNIAPTATVAGAEILRKANPVSTGLFRQEPTAPGIPLMTGQTTAGGSTFLGKYADADRQPFVALQRMMRLPNLVSNQSNVFAVRLTIGYFEFDPETGIGEEYIGQRGEVTRHRSFYMIDRSIPVGFVPGEDLNTEKTILLRRFSE